MDDHLESLRIENKMLRGKHNELESDLTEEKEMVKYLHGVIKNYQQLLKKPETTRHLKTASLKKIRRTSSARRLTSENDVEELFVKNLVEMSNVRAADRDEEDNEQLVPNDNDQCVVRDTSDCENTDRINNNSQVSDETLSASEYEKSELTPDTDKMLWDVKGQQSCGSRRSTGIPKTEEIPTETGTASTYFDRERILQEMTETLDTMMAKTTILEKSLKQKDKHLKKMERRYEYLENIALGEESEWL
ncbi:hypothetical protein ACROYT_G006866 [Oculina patagonica]